MTFISSENFPGKSLGIWLLTSAKIPRAVLALTSAYSSAISLFLFLTSGNFLLYLAGQVMLYIKKIKNKPTEFLVIL